MLMRMGEKFTGCRVLSYCIPLSLFQALNDLGRSGRWVCGGCEEREVMRIKDSLTTDFTTNTDKTGLLEHCGWVTLVGGRHWFKGISSDLTTEVS